MRACSSAREDLVPNSDVSPIAVREPAPVVPVTRLAVAVNDAPKIVVATRDGDEAEEQAGLALPRLVPPPCHREIDQKLWNLDGDAQQCEHHVDLAERDRLQHQACLLRSFKWYILWHGSAVVEHPIANRKVAGSIPAHVAPRSTRPGDSVFRDLWQISRSE